MAHLGDEISHGELEESKCYCFSYLQIRVQNYSYPPLDPPLGLDPHPGDNYDCTMIDGAVAGAICSVTKIRQHIGCIKGIHIPDVENYPEIYERDHVFNSYEGCPKSYLKYETQRRAIPFVLEPTQMDPDLVMYKEKTYTQLDICGECAEGVGSLATVPCDDTFFPTDLWGADMEDSLPEMFIVPGWDFNSGYPSGDAEGDFGPDCTPPRIPPYASPWNQVARHIPPGRPGSLRVVSTSPDPIYFNTTPDLQSDEEEIKQMLAWAEHELFLTKPEEICEVIRNRGRKGTVEGLCNLHNQGIPTNRKRLPGGFDG